jgi:hypothetical protein
MGRRALLLGVALAVALVAYPRPTGIGDGRRARGHLARVLAVWSAGPLPFAREDVPAYTVVQVRQGPELGPPPRGTARPGHGPGDGLAPEDALAALRDPALLRVDVEAMPGPGSARALRRLLAAVERRARDGGELWLVALVERDAARTAEHVVRLGLHGSAALRGPLEREVALDLRWLPDGLTSEHLEAWFVAHVAGPPETAWERWPPWLLRRPALGTELTANGDASHAWPSGSSPPGWTSEGRVVRAVTPDGRAWFEAPDGWCALSQRLTLPRADDPDRQDEPGGRGARQASTFEVRLAARFAPGARGTVQLIFESDGQQAPAAPLQITAPYEGGAPSERRAHVPFGARTALLEARLTGSDRLDAGTASVAPRLTDVSIRVVSTNE